MHAVLEYLAVGILVVVALLAVSQMVEAPSRTVETVKAEQLFTVAERLMDKILLTPGYPPNWGADVTVTTDGLKDFGVAFAGAVAPYVVDPDKVMRLANLTPLDNPAPISAERIAELLGIKGTYGFRLEMRPMIEISAEPVEWVRKGGRRLVSKLRATVRNWEGVGLPNANVTALYIIVDPRGAKQELDPNDLKTLRDSCITGPLGSCVLDFSRSLPRLHEVGSQASSFFVIHVSWEGFVSVAGYTPVDDDDQNELPISGYIIGDIVFITRPEDAPPGAIIVKDEVVQVVPQYSILLEPVEVEWCRSPPRGRDPDDPPWCHEVAANVLPSPRWAYLIGRIRSLEILSSHVIIIGKWRGDWRAAVISRIPIVDIQLGPRNVKPANSVTLTRLALIYSYPYIVRLTVWRWAEGWP